MRFSPREFVPLAPLTTLGVGGPARFFVDASDESTVLEALRWARERGLATRVLGGGSNVVAGDDGFEGLVLRLGMRGRNFTAAGADLLVEAQAGEPWDELVAETVARGAQGLECLSGIPGLVGATPIQNVGAYGQEVAETIVRVRALERATLETRELPAAACRFAYRDSWFKSEVPDGFVVLAVTFRLRPGAAGAVRYGELEQRLHADGVPPAAAPLARVRETVLALRRAKSMLLDPNDENGRSCGSFFVNPSVSLARADAIAALVTDAKMPRFSQPDGRVKLAAGWLIERAGFIKGTRRGSVGLSSKHALALVAHEGATAAAVLELAREIQSAVHARFGVALELEPVVWGTQSARAAAEPTPAGSAPPATLP
jgi:UDP-N-acetylmuramate dehydrogenase